MSGLLDTTDDDLDRLVGIPEAARRLAIGKSTAYDLIARGEFPVPPVYVNGHPRVSLRLLVEFIHARAAA